MLALYERPERCKIIVICMLTCKFHFLDSCSFKFRRVTELEDRNIHGLVIRVAISPNDDVLMACTRSTSGNIYELFMGRCVSSSLPAHPAIFSIVYLLTDCLLFLLWSR